MSTSPEEPINTHFGLHRPTLVAIMGSFVAAALGIALGFWLTPAYPYESNTLGPQPAAAPAFEAAAAPGADAGLTRADYDPLGMLPRDPD